MRKRLFKTRAILPMGLAFGLLVLWELGALPMPFGTAPGPLARAAYAIGLAMVGALLGFALMRLVERVTRSSKRRAERDSD